MALFRDVGSDGTTYTIVVPIGTTTILDSYDVANLLIEVRDTSAPVNIILSSALLASDSLLKITIKDESGGCSNNNITISTEGSETIDGQNTYVLNQDFEAVTLFHSITNWFTFAENKRGDQVTILNGSDMDVINNAIEENGNYKLESGEYDCTDTSDGINLPSRSKFTGNGKATKLFSTNLSSGSIPSMIGTVAAAKGVTIRDLFALGNSSYTAPGTRSSHNISIDGSSRSSLAEDNRIQDCLSVSGANAFRTQYDTRSFLQNLTAFNAEHGFYFYRGYNLKGVNLNAFAEAFEGTNAFMQRGMFINQMQGVQINGFTAKNFYGAGILIRAYDATESGQDANSPICKDIKLSNIEISTTSTSQTITGGIQIMTSNTEGVENITVTNAVIEVGRGNAFKFLRGLGSGSIPIKNVLVTNGKFAQKAVGAYTHYAALSVYAYEDVGGVAEPLDYAAQNVRFVNCEFRGEYPALIKWLKNIEFTGCSFEVDYGSSNYDGATFENCNNLTLTNCRFKARTAGSGYDIQIASTVTGYLRINGCTAENARVSIDTSGTTEAQFSDNFGFGYYGGDGRKRATRTLSSAELLALHTTPVTIVPGVTGRYIRIEDAFGYYGYVSAAYAVDAGDDLLLKYKDASGYYSHKFETTGFLDQTANKTSIAERVSGLMIPHLSQPIVAFLNGQILTGDGTLRIDIYYRLI